jgi:hypothetical protein
MIMKTAKKKPRLVQPSLNLGIDKKQLKELAKASKERNEAALRKTIASNAQKEHARITNGLQKLRNAIESENFNGLTREVTHEQTEFRINPHDLHKTSPGQVSEHWKFSFLKMQKSLVKKGVLHPEQVIPFDNLEKRFQKIAMNKNQLLEARKDALNRIKWVTKTTTSKKTRSEAGVANFSAAAFRDYRIINTLLEMWGIRYIAPFILLVQRAKNA